MWLCTFDTGKSLDAAQKAHNYSYVDILTNYVNIITYLNIITIICFDKINPLELGIKRHIYKLCRDNE